MVELNEADKLKLQIRQLKYDYYNLYNLYQEKINNENKIDDLSINDNNQNNKYQNTINKNNEFHIEPILKNNYPEQEENNKLHNNKLILLYNLCKKYWWAIIGISELFTAAMEILKKSKGY